MSLQSKIILNINSNTALWTETQHVFMQWQSNALVLVASGAFLAAEYHNAH